MDPVKRSRATRRALITAGGVIAVILVSDRLRSDDEELPPTATPVTGTPPTGTPPTEMPEAWRSGIPMPRAHSETPAIVIDGRIYLAGGFEAETRLDRFDPTTGLWTQLADLPVAIHHPGTAALDGKFYLAGGYSADGHTAVDAFWVYDPGANTWESLAPLPKAKGAFGLCSAGGSLWAAGGALEHLGGSASNDLLRYDPGLNRWELMAPLPTAREHLAVVAVGESIFAIGGRADGDESDVRGAANERYDLASGAWSTAAPLPIPRSGLAGTSTSEAIIVLGGERDEQLFANVNRYIPASDRWDALPSMPTGRHGTGAAVIGDDLYAIAGSTLAGQVQNTPVVEILTLSAVVVPAG